MTVATDLAVAVVVGVIVSALVFAWEHAKYIRIEAQEDHKGSTVYAVTGPLFFGSVTSFLERFDPARTTMMWSSILPAHGWRITRAWRPSIPWQSAT